MSWLTTCPYCDYPACECDVVDVGFGEEMGVQCGPYQCPECGASEIGPERYKDPTFDCSEEEKKTGWYRERISPYANTFEGKLVGHKVAKLLYRKGKLDEKTELNRIEKAYARREKN